MPPSYICTKFWPILRVLAASTALVACGAQAQYGGGSGRPVIGLPPSVELNLDVLTKLRPPPVQEMRKVPSEQPYTPPVRLPALSAPSPSVVARPTPAMPFARGESGANILSDVSSANYKAEVKPVAKPVAARPAPVAVKAPVAVPVPVASPPAFVPAPLPAVRAAAPVQPAPIPVAPRPVVPAPIITPAATPAPVAPAPIVAPVTAAQPTSVVPHINNAPMMIPVKPRTAPAPLVPPREIPVQPAPIVAPVAKPAAPVVTPPAPLPTGNVPLTPVTTPAASPPVIIPPKPAPVPVPQPIVNPVPKPVVSNAVPPMAPITALTKPSLNVPPPPSLDGLDFSNMKANDPDGFGELTPQKLLGKPVETMVVTKAATLPEIEVPAATSTEKLPTVVKEKPADRMLPSISNRVDKLFTKDDVKVGVNSDTTRVINPVADKQKELAAKADAAKKEAAKIEKATAPKQPDPLADLPPLPMPAPQEKSIKIPSAAPKTELKVTNEVPSGLPSLDAITGTKPVPSSIDVVQPKDGIIATETMPPAKLPEPVMPVVKKEEAPKIVAQEKKPAPLPPLPMPVKEVVKEVPKPAASPLAITPKEKPNIKEDTKIAALPPLPDFGSSVRKPDPALAPALPQLPPPAKIEAKKPEPVKAAPTKLEPIKAPPVEVKAPAPKAEPAKPSAPLIVPKPSSGSGSAKPSASIGFTKDATDLSPAAKSELMGLADKIKGDDASVRIVAYAKGSEDEASIARRVSLSRALQVRAFLIDKGVNQLKINVQALGHKVPSGDADRADVVVY